MIRMVLSLETFFARLSPPTTAKISKPIFRVPGSVCYEQQRLSAETKPPPETGGGDNGRERVGVEFYPTAPMAMNSLRCWIQSAGKGLAIRAPSESA